MYMYVSTHTHTHAHTHTHTHTRARARAHIYVCIVAPDARRDLADVADNVVDNVALSQKIPLTPSYSARDGSGCLGKESSRLRGNEESEKKLCKKHCGAV